MTLTPLERWKQRTNDGRNMAGGWVSAKHTPPRFAQYEVRGHPRHCFLTWAYGSWWHQGLENGDWHQQKDYYDWRGPYSDYCGVNWASVIDQAAKAGDKKAKRRLAQIIREIRRENR